MNYIKRLLAEAEGLAAEVVGKHGETLGEPETYDTVIGVVPEDIRPLFVLRNQKAKEANDVIKGGQHLCELEAALEEKDHSPAHLECHARALALAAEVELLEKMAWSSLRAAFPAELSGDGAGIRQGWKAVAIDNEGQVRGAIGGAIAELLMGGMGLRR